MAAGVHNGQPWKCERTSQGRGYCLAHWKQQHQGRPIAKLGTYVPTSTRRDEAGNYRCRTCRGHLPEDQFRQTNWGPGPDCKACATKLRRATRYGLTLEQVATLLEQQGNQCAICARDALNGDRSFAVDHDHRCCPGKRSCGNCVRGILCHACNMALGGFADDAERLQAALSYLTKPR